LLPLSRKTIVLTKMPSFVALFISSVRAEQLSHPQQQKPIRLINIDGLCSLHCSGYIWFFGSLVFSKIGVKTLKGEFE
jgi:hypothetical protein